MSERVHESVRRVARENHFFITLQKLCADPRNRINRCKIEAGIKPRGKNHGTRRSHAEIDCTDDGCKLRQKYELIIEDLRLGERHPQRKTKFIYHARELTFGMWSAVKKTMREGAQKKNRAAFDDHCRQVEQEEAAARDQRREYIEQPVGMRIDGRLMMDMATGVMVGAKADKDMFYADDAPSEEF